MAEAVQEHKSLLRDYLTELAADYADPRGVAARIHIMIEGAMVTSSLLGAEATRQARDGICAVLAAAEGARDK